MTEKCCQKSSKKKKRYKAGEGVLKPSKHYDLNTKQHSKI